MKPVLLDHKERNLANLACRVATDRRVNQVHVVCPDKTASRASAAQKATKVVLDLKVPLVCLVHPEPPARSVDKVLKVR